MEPLANPTRREVLLAAALSFTPLVIGALAPGFGKDPARFALAVELTRITFPYLLLVTLVTSHTHFAGGGP